MVSGTDSGICHRLQHFWGGLVRMQARFIDKLRFYGGVESVIIESSEILHPYPDWEQSDLSGLGEDGSGRAGGAA